MIFFLERVKFRNASRCSSLLYNVTVQFNDIFRRYKMNRFTSTSLRVPRNDLEHSRLIHALLIRRGQGWKKTMQIEARRILPDARRLSACIVPSSVNSFWKQVRLWTPSFITMWTRLLYMGPQTSRWSVNNMIRCPHREWTNYFFERNNVIGSLINWSRFSKGCLHSFFWMENRINLNSTLEIPNMVSTIRRRTSQMRYHLDMSDRV